MSELRGTLVAAFDLSVDAPCGVHIEGRVIVVDTGTSLDCEFEVTSNDAVPRAHLNATYAYLRATIADRIAMLFPNVRVAHDWRRNDG